MTIEVTGCHDCKVFPKMNEWQHECGHPKNLGAVIGWHIGDKQLHPSCPLKQETIKIKLKSDEEQENSK